MDLIHFDYLRSKDQDQDEFIKELVSERRLEKHDESCSEFMSSYKNCNYDSIVWKYHGRCKKNINKAFVDLCDFIENKLNISLEEYGTKIGLSLKYGEDAFLEMINIIGSNYQDGSNYQESLRQIYRD